MSETSFAGIQCEAEFDGFTYKKIYPIVQEFKRGVHQINGHAVFVAQTTFQVQNDRGAMILIPYATSSFSKKRNLEGITV